MMELPKRHATSLYGQPAWSLAVRSDSESTRRLRVSGRHKWHWHATASGLRGHGQSAAGTSCPKRTAGGRPLQTAVWRPLMARALALAGHHPTRRL